MKVLQLGSIIVAITITAAFPIGKNPSAEPNAAVEAEPNSEMPETLAPSVETSLFLPEMNRRPCLITRQKCQNQKGIIRLIQCGNRQTCPICLFILMAHFHPQES